MVGVEVPELVHTLLWRVWLEGQYVLALCSDWLLKGGSVELNPLLDLQRIEGFLLSWEVDQLRALGYEVLREAAVAGHSCGRDVLTYQHFVSFLMIDLLSK